MADHLVSIAPKPGDGVFIPAGTVHSLGDDLVVFEIQQNSDVTFRLYDWGHVDAKPASRGYSKSTRRSPALISRMAQPDG
ncbi:MAG: hypothetical protein ABI076_04670 [Acidobacteriaceae bacterium]